MGSLIYARAMGMAVIALIGLHGCRGGSTARSEGRPAATPSDPPAPHDRVEHGASSADGTMQWSGSGRAIEVRSRTGAVRASPASNALIEIVAHHRGGRGGDRPMRLRVADHDGVLVACVVRATCDEEGDDECSFGGEDGSDAAVDIDVRVPKGVRFAGWTGNGAVEAAHLDAEVEAHAQNGRIVLDTSRIALASTINGSIVARISAKRWDGAITLETVNGHVRVELAEGAGARLNAETVHGRIGLGVKLADARVEETHVEGRIGAGGGGLELRSVNGGIDVR